MYLDLTPEEMKQIEAMRRQKQQQFAQQQQQQQYMQQQQPYGQQQHPMYQQQQQPYGQQPYGQQPYQQQPYQQQMGQTPYSGNMANGLQPMNMPQSQYGGQAPTMPNVTGKSISLPKVRPQQQQQAPMQQQFAQNEQKEDLYPSIPIGEGKYMFNLTTVIREIGDEVKYHIEPKNYGYPEFRAVAKVLSVNFKEDIYDYRCLTGPYPYKLGKGDQLELRVDTINKNYEIYKR